MDDQKKTLIGIISSSLAIAFRPEPRSLALSHAYGLNVDSLDYGYNTVEAVVEVAYGILMNRHRNTVVPYSEISAAVEEAVEIVLKTVDEQSTDEVGESIINSGFLGGAEPAGNA